MRKVPQGWQITHHGKGRGVYTRVEFRDGTGINFSGRLGKQAATDAACKQLSAWDALGMREEGLAAFARREVSV